VIYYILNCNRPFDNEFLVLHSYACMKYITLSF